MPMKLFDISPAISSELKVWPGDTPPSRELLRDMNAGGNLTLSTLRATVHLGAHADAPSHYDAGGESIERRRLDYYLGPCQVVRVDGKRAAELDLPGKPAPDTFLRAARELGVDASRAVVVEDAISGVQAGRNGGFGLVIGVARHDEPYVLREQGADVVVSDLGELSGHPGGG